MTKRYLSNKWIGYSGALAFAAIFMVGCVSDVKKDDGAGEEKPAAAVDSSEVKLMSIGGSMFSIPSPIGLANLLASTILERSKPFIAFPKKASLNPPGP